jgi:hypothetical protein
LFNAVNHGSDAVGSHRRVLVRLSARQNGTSSAEVGVFEKMATRVPAGARRAAFTTLSLIDGPLREGL